MQPKGHCADARRSTTALAATALSFAALLPERADASDPPRIWCWSAPEGRAASHPSFVELVSVYLPGTSGGANAADQACDQILARGLAQLLDYGRVTRGGHFDMRRAHPRSVVHASSDVHTHPRSNGHADFCPDVHAHPGPDLCVRSCCMRQYHACYVTGTHMRARTVCPARHGTHAHAHTHKHGPARV